MIQLVISDGGRAAAGVKGKVGGDCVTRAIATATGMEYGEVAAALDALGAKERSSKRRRGMKSSSRNGVYRACYEKLLTSLGWKFTPTMQIGSGCRVHLREDELPGGRLVVVLSKHLVAVIDGVLYDNHDPSRRGTRCVYGYYRKVLDSNT